MEVLKQVQKRVISLWAGSKPGTRKAALIIGAFVVFLGFRNAFIKLKRKYNKTPPGFSGLPIIGSLGSFGLDQNKFLRNCKKYGDLTSFNLANQAIIALNDSKIAIEVLKNENCLNRNELSPKWPISKSISVSRVNGKLWSYYRKLVHTNFMQLLNSKNIENSLNYSLNEQIFPHLDSLINNNELWYCNKSVNYVSFNSVFNIAFGRNVEFKESEMIEYLETLQKRMKVGGLAFLLGMFGVNFSIIINLIESKLAPFHETHSKLFQKWILETSGYDGYRDCNYNVSFKFKGKENIKYKTEDTNFTKLMINEYNKCLENDTNINTNSKFKLDLIGLWNHIEVLFLAGVDTTGNSSEYALVLLSKHPNIQSLIYNQLKEEMRLNNLNDFSFLIINKLHYLRAFVYESLRLSSAVAIGVPRYTINDIKIKANKNKEYIIPKNTVIITNVKNCNNDTKYWKGGNNLDLNNFLDSSNHFKMNKNLLTFSIGKRDCPGQAVATRSMYGLIAKLVLNYKFSLENQNIEIKQQPSVVRTIYPKIGIKVEKRY